MRSDIGGSPLVVAHLPRRRARGHLFTDQGRNLLLAAIAAVALIAALGVLADQGLSVSAPRSFLNG